MPKHKLSTINVTFMILVFFALGFVAGTAYFDRTTPLIDPSIHNFSAAGDKVVQMGIPAVDENGNGVVGTLVTTIRPGSGQVLVNVNDVLAQFDTQQSARTAVQAAQSYTRVNMSRLDVIYDIKVNASVIEGPSAGAAMSTAVVLGLEDIPSTDRIIMTGTINPDGSIGKIGGALEKATAAKAAGATLFLVPTGQSTDLQSARIRNCNPTAGFQICQVKYQYSQVDIGQAINITVKEVGNIGEAVGYFQKLSQNPNASV